MMKNHRSEHVCKWVNVSGGCDVQWPERAWLGCVLVMTAVREGPGRLGSGAVFEVDQRPLDVTGPGLAEELHAVGSAVEAGHCSQPAGDCRPGAADFQNGLGQGQERQSQLESTA